MNEGIEKFFKFKDFFSLLCAIFGFFSIIAIFDKNFGLASIFLIFSMIFDYFDGFFARKFSHPTEYGAYIDTISDGVAFAITPAIFIYFYSINDFYFLFYFFVAIIVLSSGIMRLARYLCLKHEKFYVGLPITFNGIIIPFIYFLSHTLQLNLFFLCLISSYLMISKINFKKI